MPFGQIVIGPPGSGKTTYCNGMQQFLQGLGRPTIVVNLDPANDAVPYECAINIQDLVSLEGVMDKLDLGPNGGMIYCMEYLIEKNLDWLETELKKYVTLHPQNGEPPRSGFVEHYVLFDCPGQVELYTHHQSMRHFTELAQKLWDFRLAAVHLVDAHYCSDPSKYISALLVSLSTMMNLELPHINVLSKIDLVEQYGTLSFDMDYYTEVQDLSYLIRVMDKEHQAGDGEQVQQEQQQEQNERQADQADSSGQLSFYEQSKAARIAFHESLAQVIEDYSYVQFVPLNIQDKHSVHAVLKRIDKANGYVFGILNEHAMQSSLYDDNNNTLHNKNKQKEE